jgi:dTMP kinase
MNTPTKHPGIFIVIEGVDGSGKTTLAQRLVGDLNDDKEFLQQQDYAGAIYIQEPGTTSFGKGFRPLFLHPEQPLAPMTEVMGLIACKIQLMDEIIRPAVRRGGIVICDRYTRTLLAYQGGLRGVPNQKIVNLLAESGYLIPPNLELFLTVSEDTSATRRGTDLNAMDELARTQGAKLRQGFRDALASLPPYRSIEIDADHNFDIVYEKALAEVKRYLKFHRISGLTIPDPVPQFIPEVAPKLIEPVKPESDGAPVIPELEQEPVHDHESPVGDGEA